MCAFCSLDLWRSKRRNFQYCSPYCFVPCMVPRLDNLTRNSYQIVLEDRRAKCIVRRMARLWLGYRLRNLLLLVDILRTYVVDLTNVLFRGRWWILRNKNHLFLKY